MAVTLFVSGHIPKGVTIFCMTVAIISLSVLLAFAIGALLYREYEHGKEREKLVDRLMSRDLNEYKQFYAPQEDPVIPQKVDDGFIDIADARQEIENGD